MPWNLSITLEYNKYQNQVDLLWLPLLCVPSQGTTTPTTSPVVVWTVSVRSAWQMPKKATKTKMGRVLSILEMLVD